MMTAASVMAAPLAIRDRRWLVAHVGSNYAPHAHGWWRTIAVELPRHRSAEVEATSLDADVEQALRWIADEEELPVGYACGHCVVTAQGSIVDEATACEWAEIMEEWTPAAVPAIGGAS